MKARYAGWCARTRRRFCTGTQIVKTQLGWEIDDDVPAFRVEPRTPQPPLESKWYPVAWSKILGLNELFWAEAAEEEWLYQFNRMMEDEGNDGAYCPNPPKINVVELEQAYPLAQRYRYCLSNSHPGGVFAIYETAKRALKAIEDGTDPELALDEFDRECSASSSEWILFH